MSDVEREAAQALWEAGRRQEAISALEELLVAAPEDAAAMHQLAGFCLQIDDYRGARRLFDNLLNLDAGDTEALLGAIDAALAAGDLDDALGLGQTAVDRHVGDVRCHLRLAEAQAASGDRRGADATLRTAVAKRPNHARLWMTRIDLSIDAAEWVRAAGLIDEAPDAVLAAPAFRIRRAKVLAATGQTEAAIAMLEDLHDEAPRNLQVLIALARLQVAQGDHRGSERSHAAILAVNPAHRGAHIGRIDAAIALEDMRYAISLCETAVGQLGPDPAILRRQGQALIRSGRVIDALAVLQTTISDRAAPEFTLIDVLVTALLTVGDWAEADAQLVAFLEREPAHHGAWKRRVDVAMAQGDADAALALCETALTATQDHTALLIKAAEILQKSMRHRDSLDLLEGLEDAERERPSALLWRARAWEGLYRHDKAADLYRAILKADPQHSAAKAALDTIAEAASAEAERTA